MDENTVVCAARQDRESTGPKHTVPALPTVPAAQIPLWRVRKMAPRRFSCVAPAAAGRPVPVPRAAAAPLRAGTLAGPRRVVVSGKRFDLQRLAPAPAARADEAHDPEAAKALEAAVKALGVALAAREETAAAERSQAVTQAVLDEPDLPVPSPTASSVAELSPRGGLGVPCLPLLRQSSDRSAMSVETASAPVGRTLTSASMTSAGSGCRSFAVSAFQETVRRVRSPDITQEWIQAYRDAGSEYPRFWDPAWSHSPTAASERNQRNVAKTNRQRSLTRLINAGKVKEASKVVVSRGGHRPMQDNSHDVRVALKAMVVQRRELAETRLALEGAVQPRKKQLWQFWRRNANKDILDDDDPGIRRRSARALMPTITRRTDDELLGSG